MPREYGYIEQYAKERGELQEQGFSQRQMEKIRVQQGTNKIIYTPSTRKRAQAGGSLTKPSSMSIIILEILRVKLSLCRPCRRKSHKI